MLETRIFTCILVTLFALYGVDCTWWVLGTQSIAANSVQSNGRGREYAVCNSLRTINERQKAICRKYADLIVSVAVGARLSIDECKRQFASRRWNCPVLNEGTSVFGPILKRGTRESAFIHAITAAGVAYAVTESCAQGSSRHCSCDNSPKANPSEDWKWGGCSRDVRFGLQFSERFVDATDGNKKTPRRDMNRHNNRAGREAILDQLWRKCKCHGLSGSCNIKTCWINLPKFRTVGELLRVKYDSAHEMLVWYKTIRDGRTKYKRLKPKYKEYVRPTSKDLVYYEPSPNFCRVDKPMGSVGTSGRECNVTSYRQDGCELMCCRRGYNVKTVTVTKSCNCKFVWCCKVRCEKCTQIKTVYTCK